MNRLLEAVKQSRVVEVELCPSWPSVNAPSESASEEELRDSHLSKLPQCPVNGDRGHSGGSLKECPVNGGRGLSGESLGPIKITQPKRDS